eukprot:3448018-Rhodomonas_salina.1
MDAAAVAAMQAQMITMAATIARLEAAAGAPVAAAQAIDLAAFAAAAYAEKYVETYKGLVGCIRANKESLQLHSDKTLLHKFLLKLQQTVQLHFNSSKLSSVEDAYAEAVQADKLVFAANQATTTPTTPAGCSSLAGTPLPPPAMLAFLTAMGYDWDAAIRARALRARQNDPQLCLPQSQWASPPSLMISKDHSIAG